MLALWILQLVLMLAAVLAYINIKLRRIVDGICVCLFWNTEQTSDAMMQLNRSLHRNKAHTDRARYAHLIRPVGQRVPSPNTARLSLASSFALFTLSSARCHYLLANRRHLEFRNFGPRRAEESNVMASSEKADRFRSSPMSANEVPVFLLIPRLSIAAFSSTGSISSFCLTKQRRFVHRVSKSNVIGLSNKAIGSFTRSDQFVF